MNSQKDTASWPSVSTWTTRYQTVECHTTKSPHSHPHKLDPTDFVPLTLLKVTKLSHDTSHYVFGVEKSKEDLPVSSFMLTKADGLTPDGKPAIRPYTPVNISLEEGKLELVVKVYEKGVMSKHFGTLKEGDSLLFKGPIDKFKYQANAYKHIGMVAGGTGITPEYQVIRKILENPSDKTKVTLLYANKTEEDILLRHELDALAKKHPKQFTVHYWVETANKHWKGHVGRVDKDSLIKHMPAPGSHNMTLVCGPPGFYNVMSGAKGDKGAQGELGGYLKEMGYTSQEVFKL